MAGGISWNADGIEVLRAKGDSGNQYEVKWFVADSTPSSEQFYVVMKNGEQVGGGLPTVKAARQKIMAMEYEVRA